MHLDADYELVRKYHTYHMSYKPALSLDCVKNSASVRSRPHNERGHGDTPSHRLDSYLHIVRMIS